MESTNTIYFCDADKKRLQPTYMNDDGLFIVNLVDFLMNPAKFRRIRQNLLVNSYRQNVVKSLKIKQYEKLI